MKPLAVRTAEAAVAHALFTAFESWMTYEQARASFYRGTLIEHNAIGRCTYRAFHRTGRCTKRVADREYLCPIHTFAANDLSLAGLGGSL